MKYLFAIFAILFIAQPVWADHELDIYSMENLFIYDTFTKGSALKTIHIVVLDDNQPLEIAGSIQSHIDANVDAFANYKKYLIALLWNYVEIFDLSNPKIPRLVKMYKLEEHKPWPGHDRIIKDGNTFLLLSTKTSSRLIMDEKIEKWQLEPFNRTEEIHKSTFVKPIFPSFNDFQPFVVEESPNFTFEVRWKTKQLQKYEWSHEKYLVKVRKSDSTIVSEILLGKVVETGGN
ncbi:hypothetical protein KKE26_01990 [bacterium]|nr:hypothetical protein [bacterium]MBU1754118.1 hypothetical protein [bacterium]